MGRSLDRIGGRTSSINPPRAQLCGGYKDYCYGPRGRFGVAFVWPRTAAGITLINIFRGHYASPGTLIT
ncbi:hypothetical protein WN48_06121 [Eufriesea mexicana]|nr:hypothetical protein WN48_06121 [Eufriesea mexicana]